MSPSPSISTLSTLCDLLVAEHNIQRETLHDSVTLDSLGIDSLGTIELLWMVEQQFGIELPTESAHEFETLGDIVQFIDALIEYQLGGAPATSTSASNAPGL